MARQEIVANRKRRLGLTKRQFHAEMAALPVGAKGYPNVFSEVERLENDNRGRPQFRMTCSRLPKITTDGLDIDQSWFESSKGYYTRINCGIAANVTDKGVMVASQGRVSRWDPVLTVGGVEYGPLGKPSIIDDPDNDNYHENCLSFDYGVCERRLRVIEGHIREWWIFSENPHAEIRIKHNFDGSLPVRIGTAWSKDPIEGQLVCDVDGDTEIVSKESLRGIRGPIYIGASPETFLSSTSDGYLNTSGAVYATIQAATTGTVSDTLDNVRAGQSLAGETYHVYRGAVFFDTSSLSESAIISAAVLSFYGYYNSSDTDFNVIVTNGQPTYPHDSMVVGDYNKTNYSGEGGSYATSGGWSTVGYNDITLTSTGRGWINKGDGATTKLVLRSSRDISATTPSGREQVIGYDAEEGAGKQPKLVVTYTVPVAPTVTTQAVDDIVPGGGTLNGNITDDGGASISQHGFCWKAGSDPVNIAGADGSSTLGVGAEGAFDQAKTGLTENTAYYVRAYGTNSHSTAYGAAVSWTTGETLSGVVSITAVPSVSPNGDLVASGVASISATPSMTITPLRIRQGVTVLSVVPSMAIVGLRQRLGIASISAVPSVTANGDLVASGVAAISATPSMVINADLIASGVVSIEAIASVVAAGNLTASAAVLINAVASVIAKEANVYNVECAINIVPSVTAAGNLTASGVVSINTVASLTALATRIRFGVVSIEAIASLVALADRIRYAAASITASASLTAAAQLIASGVVDIEAVASMSLDGDAIKTALASIQVVASMTADPLRIRQGVAAITATPSMTIDGDLVASGVASINVTTSLGIIAQLIASGVCLIDSIVAVTIVDGDTRKSGKCHVTITPSVTGVPLRIRQGVAAIDVIPSLTIDGDLIASAIAAIEAVATVTAEPLRIRPAACAISSIASLTADGDAIRGGIAAIAIVASMTAAGNLIASGAVSIEAIMSLLATGTTVKSGSVSITAVSSVQAVALAYITQSLGYTGTLTAGDVLEIDTDNMTVKLNGTNARANMTGTFPKLYVGTNELRWKDEDGSRDLDLEVDHKPRHL